jgi:hypothetical protein
MSEILKFTKDTIFNLILKIGGTDHKITEPAKELIYTYVYPLIEEYEELKKEEKIDWIRYRRINYPSSWDSLTSTSISQNELIPSNLKLVTFLIESILPVSSPMIDTGLHSNKMKSDLQYQLPMVTDTVSDYSIDHKIYTDAKLYLIFPGWRPVAEIGESVITEVEVPWINWKRGNLLRFCHCAKSFPYLTSRQILTAIKETQIHVLKFTEFTEILNERMKPATFTPDAVLAVYNIIRYMILLIYGISPDVFLELVTFLTKHVSLENENSDSPLLLYQTILVALGCEQIEANLMESGGINTKTIITYTDVCKAYYYNSFWNFEAFILPPPSSWDDIIPPCKVIKSKTESI